jgi:hypothetical protein
MCVSDNAEMIAWKGYQLHGCLYPLTIAPGRFKTNLQYKYIPLVHYRDNDQ